MNKKRYKKYTYWTSPDHIKEIQSYFKTKNKRLRWARGVVCTPLDPLNKIGLISPQVWDETCERQGSWYRSSARAGQYILVSDAPINHPLLEPNTIIRLSSFQTSRTASEPERQKLVDVNSYRDREPKEWTKIDERERKRWNVMLAKFKVKADLTDLLDIHSANHANFLEPALYIENGSAPIPYSIDGTDFLCSCCLELFNIIGDRFPEKLVRPCLGAMLYARMERDRFYSVIRMNRTEVE